jgi:hypothetical protein
MDTPIITTSPKNKNELFTIAYDLINCYMNEFLMSMKEPHFHEDLFNSVLSLMQNMFENTYDDILDGELRVVIQKACSTYFSQVLPRRSYSKTFAKPRINIPKITSIIERLRSVPQSEQRSPEWFSDRWNMISASSAWKALSSNAHKNSIIYEKCSPLDTSKYSSSVNVSTPLHWGQKYETLSVLIYEDKYNTKIEDFGCIPHKDYANIGASPDGINTDPVSSRYGRMLEVKNRFSESVPITGIPKHEYWIQMQLQMNVCELNECDFWETRFKEYENASMFYEDGTFTHTVENKMKGIYLYFSKNGFPHYEFPPLHLSEAEFIVWEDSKMKSVVASGYEWISRIYWYLDKASCVLVFRNKAWFAIALAEIKVVWNTILEERISGYEHRAPNKRVKKPVEPIKSNCMIDINGLNL